MLGTQVMRRGRRAPALLHSVWGRPSRLMSTVCATVLVAGSMAAIGSTAAAATDQGFVRPQWLAPGKAPVGSTPLAG